MEKIPVGVVGVGYFGRKHVEEYRQLDAAELVLVADTDETRCAEIKKTFAVPTATTNFNDVLDHRSLAAVSLCTPNETHAKLAMKLLEYEKHVLIEKPLCTTVREGEKLLRLAERKSHLVVHVGHIFRFNNALNTIKHYIENGKFGSIYLLSMRWTTLIPSPDRDVVSDLSPHLFDMVHHLLGSWPKTISAIGKAVRRQEKEEFAIVFGETHNGIAYHMEMGWLTPGKHRIVEIVGEKAYAHIDALSQEITLVESGKTYPVVVEKNNTLRDELFHFIQSIQKGNTSSSNDIAAGFNTVVCIEAALKSLRKKKLFTLQESVYV